MVIKTSGTQKESQTVNVDRKQGATLHYDVEYDSTNPEETIRKFADDIKGMLARYEGNKARIFEIEAELNDMEHYMEIGKFKNVPEGYKLYRKLAELRRERRACKNENDLLWPVYEHFHATEVLNKLTLVQGECAKAKSAIDSRTYAVRTDVLDEWIEPEDNAGIGLNLLTGETKVMTIPVPGTDSSDSVPKTKAEKKFTLAWTAESKDAVV